MTGESLGQVASQTLENIRATDAAVGLPVFRPLIGKMCIRDRFGMILVPRFVLLGRQVPIFRRQLPQ